VFSFFFLKTAGLGLILLTFVHLPIGRYLHWREDARNLSPENEQIFHVHTFFICLSVLMMGLSCLLAPMIFVEKSQAGLWVSASLAVFWGMRFYFQFFVYRRELWRGKRLETIVHWSFALIWLLLALLFALCVMIQLFT
jgi:hypothetical protein